MTARQKPKSEEPAEPSFEESLARLEAIVGELEEGRVGLAEALAGYEEGVKLLRRCHAMLQKAERRIELLGGVDADGVPICSPLNDASLSLEEKAAQRSRRRWTEVPADAAPDRVDDSDPTSTDRSDL